MISVQVDCTSRFADRIDVSGCKLDSICLELLPSDFARAEIMFHTFVRQVLWSNGCMCVVNCRAM